MEEEAQMIDRAVAAKVVAVVADEDCRMAVADAADGTVTESVDAVIVGIVAAATFAGVAGVAGVADVGVGVGVVDEARVDSDCYPCAVTDLTLQS
ncbi:hypothetical protein GQ42DRAFT_163399 [Ramicandelaber brevisporus]|nr:hypothetical protein GQ42DRAFT_163399 [Ramicandelaber brevisporus]